MDKLKVVENCNFEPVWIEDFDMDLYLKYHILFTKYENEVVAVINKKDIPIAFNFFAKQNFPFKMLVTDEESFERLYNKFLEIKTDKSLNKEQIEEDISEEEYDLSEFLKISQDLLDSEDAAPIIKLVNAIFYQAIKRKVSDIHIEPHENKGEIRYRIDGALTKYMDLEKKVYQLVVSRIKVISNLDIAEKRIPQDGRTAITISGKKLDVRVSTLPTYYGERVVMRILMHSESIPKIDELGFDNELTNTFKTLLRHSHGMILVTGPTGSGKSTTLHSFLQEIATPDKNIITVEDPVEYNAQNINQVQVNEKVGLTFATALRSILRQDPDVVMIGEIRDKETASIAIRAAMTGHLVFSTLHTNNSTSAITRLVDMGIEPFLLSSSLLGVFAQRLVRKLCDCKIIDDNELFKEEFDIPKDTIIYKAKGCNKCNFTGYIGRVPIGELFVIDKNVQHLLKTTTNDTELRELAINQGLKTISEKLKEMVINGETSIDEAIRVGIKDE